MPYLSQQSDGSIRLAVKVVPGASRDRIVGVLGDSLKIAISAPPERGQANRAVIALIAGKLQIAGNQIEIVKGQTSPRKELSIRGITMQHITDALGSGA